MPHVPERYPVALLFVVQFFTWVGMFTLWVFSLPLITIALGSDGAVAIRWVGICFALYVTLAAVISLALPRAYEKLGKGRTHALALLVGAAGLIALGNASRPVHLLLGFTAVAVGWASISSTPYTLVTDTVSDGRYARAMAIFNFSTVIPQVAVALALGPLVEHVSAGTAMIAGGASMAIAAALMLALSKSPAA